MKRAISSVSAAVLLFTAALPLTPTQSNRQVILDSSTSKSNRSEIPNSSPTKSSYSEIPNNSTPAMAAHPPQATRAIETAIEVEVVPEPTPTPTPIPTAPPAPAGSKYDWMAAAGIPQSDWQYADFIVSKESGWNPNAVNPSSGACGLGQQLPCGKWAGAWNDPVAALRAQHGYVVARYGSYAGAYAFWLKNSWY